MATAWLDVQLKLVRTTPVVPALVFGRPFGYIGIAGYEAVVPGIAGASSLGRQLNGLTGLPVVDKNLAYSWPLSANAALAALSRGMFANTSAANKATIDSLETATAAAYAAVGAEVQARSAAFGKQVGAAVLDWAKTDGYDNATAYVPPAGPGRWVPTAPAFAPAAFPYWGNNRPLVAGSGDGADPGPPTPYSETPGSPFYLMAQEVYDLAQALTPEQRAIALFWNDAPNGRNFTAPGHWVSILNQVLAKEGTPLDRALLAYAKVGISMSDAAVSCFKTKYTYSLLRPISYVRGPLGHPAWLSLLVAPNFPDYSSTHATLSAAAAAALSSVFGPNYAFTDQNYAQFGLGHPQLHLVRASRYRGRPLARLRRHSLPGFVRKGRGPGQEGGPEYQCQAGNEVRYARTMSKQNRHAQHDVLFFLLSHLTPALPPRAGGTAGRWAAPAGPPRCGACCRSVSYPGPR